MAIYNLKWTPISLLTQQKQIEGGKWDALVQCTNINVQWTFNFWKVCFNISLSWQISHQFLTQVDQNQVAPSSKRCSTQRREVYSNIDTNICSTIVLLHHISFKLRTVWKPATQTRIMDLAKGNVTLKQTVHSLLTGYYRTGKV